MASTKDYYEILGVSKTASAEELKKVYRKLAREHHPDMVADSDKAGAEKRFKEINEAYQVLSDPQKKQQYDQYGHASTSASAGGPGGPGGQQGPFSYSYTSGGQGFGGADPFDIFEEVFGFRGFRGQRRPKKGKNLFYEMRVDFADAVKGVERDVTIESGNVTVKIPAGISGGTEMRFPGKGMPGPDKLPSGDLYITFRVATPQEFQRAGANLGLGREINFADAILGTTVEVPVVSLTSSTGVEKVKMKIPSGTQHGQQIKLKGKGMPSLRGSGRGDVIVQMFVKMPKRVNRKQKKILEEYRNL